MAVESAPLLFLDSCQQAVRFRELACIDRLSRVNLECSDFWIVSRLRRCCCAKILELLRHLNQLGPKSLKRNVCLTQDRERSLDLLLIEGEFLFQFSDQLFLRFGQVGGLLDDCRELLRRNPNINGGIFTSRPMTTPPVSARNICAAARGFAPKNQMMTASPNNKRIMMISYFAVPWRIWLTRRDLRTNALVPTKSSAAEFRDANWILNLHTRIPPVASRSPRSRRCSAPFDVRFRSLADICSAKWHVRFTPNSGHQSRHRRCPLCAESRHQVKT